MIKFFNCEKPISEIEFAQIEEVLNFKFPKEFREHYLQYNGGEPEKTFWKNDKLSFEISDFISILFNKEFRNDPSFSLPGRVIEEWENNEVPSILIPFAMNWEGNYVCINISDSKIYFFDRDEEEFNPVLIEESFGDFINSLEESKSEEIENRKIVEHTFWGQVEQDWAGISAEKLLKLPDFTSDEITIFLGEEFDDEGEEIDELPTKRELDSFEKTLKSFLDNLDEILIEIKSKAFDRYKKIYAKYYEDSGLSGKEPLNIHTVDEHFEYMRDLKYVRILKKNTIQILINYDLDNEHGLEIKLKNNKVVCLGGIAET
ncbi:SMI1/KNR4 family protein [Flavobacterium ginsengiterrae]|uniref:Knr4/Smi1-like domain-containing protein n=1 Tax=Flavobacterium ginsengiterrae TaxID=871695 RepID=A0ABP7GJP3_9FLAO